MLKFLTGIVVILSLIYGQFALAQSEAELTTLTLKNRQPQDIVPVIEPFLGPEDQIKSFDNQIILKTSPENLIQIKAMIEKLDQPLSQLMVAVSQSKDAPTEQTALFLRGSRNESKNSIQRIQVISGNTAHIATGETLSLGLLGDTSIESGIYVKPTLTGKQVTLDISTRDEDPQQNLSHSTTHAQTSIVIPLDKWVDLGGIDIQRYEKKRVLFLEAGKQAQETHHLWIQVKLIK